jgi:hypothetical protein
MNTLGWFLICLMTLFSKPDYMAQYLTDEVERAWKKTVVVYFK